MAARTSLRMQLLWQTALLTALVLAAGMGGVRAELEDGDSDLVGGAFETPVVHHRSSPFVRRQLMADSRGSSCNNNKAICSKSPYPAGSLCCGSQCAPILTDSNNCGSCGNKCAWGQTCCSGSCVYLASDNKNCGACDQKCPKKGCKSGVCQYTGRY